MYTGAYCKIRKEVVFESPHHQKVVQYMENSDYELFEVYKDSFWFWHLPDENNRILKPNEY